MSEIAETKYDLNQTTLLALQTICSGEEVVMA